MSRTIKGFIEIPSNANNAPDSVAALGELSLKARTYSRKKQYIADDSAPGLEFTVFYAKDLTGTDVDNLGSADCLPLLLLVNEIRNNFVPANGTLVDFISANADPSLSTFAFGNLITENGITLPRSLNCVHTDTEVTNFEIWFSNSVFMDEYEPSETLVLPPVNPITDLYQGYTPALAALSSFGEVEKLNALNAKTLEDKPTEIGTFILKWNDPTNLSNQFETVWYVLGYGNDALRTDKTLEAIRTYLEDETPYTVDEWKEYFPDIQTLDVFNLIPLWDKVALSAGPGVDSMMRPLFKFSELVSLVNPILIGRDTNDILDQGEGISLLFRALPVFILAGDKNDPAVQSFESLFPDYTIIALNDQSINRVSAATQSIISTMDSLARAAEIDNGSQTLPTGITRNQISGINFLEKADNNIVYRMVTRAAYLEVI